MNINYRANICKWLPHGSIDLVKFFEDSLLLNEEMNKLKCQTAQYVKNTMKADFYDPSELKNFIRSIEWIIRKFKIMTEESITQNIILKYKVKYLIFILKKNLNIVARYTKNVINKAINYMNDEHLMIIFKLINIYNELVNLNHNGSESIIHVFYNDCPNMFESLKHFSIARILKILVENQTEERCHELIDYLFKNYRSNIGNSDIIFSTSYDMDISENSSIEIYRTLTEHLKYSVINTAISHEETFNVESIHILLNSQNKQIVRLLEVIKVVSPYLLNTDATKIENDEIKVRKTTIKKIAKFYQELVLNSVSNILDHTVLWWLHDALALQYSCGSQDLKNWLQKFIQRKDVPSCMRPSLQTLCDALRRHVTITIWDQFFRLAYIAAFDCQSKISTAVSKNSRSSMTKGTDTGYKFVDVFEHLTTLSNECEINEQGVMGTSVIEFPFSEQILILHRMDHSIHIMRLWAVLESKMIAHTWELEVFFLMVKGDIINCIDNLSHLKLADHINELVEEKKDIQIYVCSKMRMKVVSEIKTNIHLLEDAPVVCIKMLAKFSRIICLSCLDMYLPKSIYWKKNSITSSPGPNFYVETYFQRILLPVLEVTEDFETSNMILQIMCESWLHYIYIHKLRFSEWGATQLLTDFSYILTWVSNCTIISEKTRQHLLKNEVLRRCEGVGRLLLRHSGEAISMNKKLNKRISENESLESFGLERMPAEMYVPNQEQWLEFRVSKHYNFCCL